jgi:diadenosine tetraphosphate (Ap4A) HIT family hydrolase
MSESRLDLCPFCEITGERVIEAVDHAYAVLDAYPVSRGHTLIVVRRHIADVFALEEEELTAIARLIRSARGRIDHEYQPAGYNIGVNAGRAAGQTIMHVHFHMIPRYFGDSPDPTGGVRNVILGKGRYTIDQLT